MFYGDVLETIIDSFKEGMDAAEIERLRGMAKSFLANYNPPSVDDESDEVEDEDARKAIISMASFRECGGKAYSQTRLTAPGISHKENRFGPDAIGYAG